MTEVAEVPSFVPPTKAKKVKAKKAKPKAKAKAKEKPAPAVKRSKFEDLYPDNAVLVLLVEENPKRKGSKAREMFEGYFGAGTVGEARANGVSYQSIAYDIGRRFIRVD